MKRTIQAIIIVAVLFGIGIMWNANKEADRKRNEARQQSALVANEWFQTAFVELQELGIVVSADWNDPGVDQSIFVVRVNGPIWRPLPHKEKMKLLKVISRMNFMRGFPEWVMIRNDHSNMLYAEIISATPKVYY